MLPPQSSLNVGVFNKARTPNPLPLLPLSGRGLPSFYLTAKVQSAEQTCAQQHKMKGLCAR